MVSAKNLGYKPKDKKLSPIQEAAKRRIALRKETAKNTTPPPVEGEPGYKNIEESDAVKKRKKVGY